MRWIDLFVVSGVIFQTSCIMRWINLFGLMLDGF
jgi:hypothetical protein